MEAVTPYISVVMGIHNRANLLKWGLSSLAFQSYGKDNYEIIVVDQGSTDNVRQVILDAKEYCNVRYLRIDLSKFDGELYKGPSYNPALQQNVGIRQAKGDIVVLTSPEIVHADSNLEVISRMAKMETKISLYGKVFESPLEWVELLQGCFDYDALNSLPRGVTLLPNLEGEHRISAYFVGAFWKSCLEEIGGMDEDYMRGIAFEDDDFGLRMAAVAKPVYSDKILGIHLPHDRSYQRDYGWDKNSQLFNEKGFGLVPKLIDHYYAPAVDYAVNQNRVWGNPDLIVEEL